MCIHIGTIILIEMNPKWHHQHWPNVHAAKEFLFLSYPPFYHMLKIVLLKCLMTMMRIRIIERVRSIPFPTNVLWANHHKSHNWRYSNISLIVPLIMQSILVLMIILRYLISVKVLLLLTLSSLLMTTRIGLLVRVMFVVDKLWHAVMFQILLTLLIATSVENFW